MATPKTLDDVVERLDRVVDLTTLANSFAAVSERLLQKALEPAPPAPPVARPDLPGPARPAEVAAAVLGQALAPAPAQPPPLPATPAPGAPQAPAGEAEKPRAKVGPWGKVWRAVKRRSGYSGLRAAVRKGRRLGRATGVKGAGTAGGVAGGLAGGVGLVASAFNQLKGATERLTDQQLDTVRRLSAVSGSMAAIQAELEVRDIRRDIERGEATAGSAKELADAAADRKDAEAKLGSRLDNLLNPLLAFGNKALGALYDGFNDLLDLGGSIEDRVKDLAAKGEGGGPAPVGLAALEEDVRREADRVGAAGRAMMDLARREASAPAGAARPGMLP